MYIMETNNRSQREKTMRNFISGSEFAVRGEKRSVSICGRSENE